MVTVNFLNTKLNITANLFDCIILNFCTTYLMLTLGPLTKYNRFLASTLRQCAFQYCAIRKSEIEIDVLICLPSSLVLTVLTEPFVPSPTEVKANTCNSYSVYLRSPVTVLVKMSPSLIGTVIADPTKPFFL